MIKIHYNSKLFNLPFLKAYAAITLPWAIYVKYSEAETPKTMINHEMIHMMQRAKYSTLGFYLLYIWYSIKGFFKYKSATLSYQNNPLEIQAYSLQNNPPEQLP